MSKGPHRCTAIYFDGFLHSKMECLYRVQFCPKELKLSAKVTTVVFVRTKLWSSHSQVVLKLVTTCSITYIKLLEKLLYDFMSNEYTFVNILLKEWFCYFFKHRFINKPYFGWIFSELILLLCFRSRFQMSERDIYYWFLAYNNL